MTNHNLRILLDIGHPAHVHYFKNFIRLMKEKEHDFIIIARNRDIIFDLLHAYNFDFISRGYGSTNIFGKIFYVIKADLQLYTIARKFNPDLFLSFGSMYAAHAARLLMRPHIAFDDTEHAKLEHILYAPFTDIICVPSCFKKKIGKKQMTFNGYMELCYLHPKYFKPDPGILDLLSVEKGEKYVIMRFVSWEASHDIGHKGISLENKISAVKEFSKYAKVFISSECPLPDDLKKYRINIPPEKMHHALSFANLYFGESPTMTTESAILGVPAICVSSWACDCGNFKDLSEKYDLISCYTPEFEEIALKNALNIIKDNAANTKWKSKQKKLLSEKIDVTAFMVWLIENYPKSFNVMKENPNYQLNFI